MQFDDKKFFDMYRDAFGRLTQRQVEALREFNSRVMIHFGRFTLQEWAYLYATTHHETKYTFEPVKEAFWLSEAWRAKNLRYHPHYGRGFVQITWDYNYETFSKLLGIDLVKNPNRALDPKVAFDIMVIGCERGLFTGIPIKGIRFEEFYTVKGKKELGKFYARRVINGTDKAAEIADHYNTFLNILQNTFDLYQNSSEKSYA